MRAAVLAFLAILLPVTGFGQQRDAGSEPFSSTLNLIAEIKKIAVEQARKELPATFFKGGAILDAGDVAHQLRSLAGPDFDSETVRRGLRSGIQDDSVRFAGRPDAVQCEREARCTILDHSIFIQIDSVEARGDDVDVVMTYAWTWERPTGNAGIGITQQKLTFRRAGGQWSLQESRVLRQS